MKSRPLRARGLKQKEYARDLEKIESRPLRARGLKLRNEGKNYNQQHCRAPCGRVD